MTSITQTIEKLIDQEARDRFAQETDLNFSVIAPAGVGKTTAIVQRIRMIASSSDYQNLPSKLSKLVVVTYTQKAADEMKKRAYQALLHSEGSIYALQELNKAFFGTIHSFCFKLIQSYGSGIGIPSNLSLLLNDEDLWQEFLNSKGNFLNLLPEDTKKNLNSSINFDKLIQLAHKLSLEALPKTDLPPYPKTDLTAVLNYTSTRSAQKVSEIQKELEAWLRELEENPVALGIPEVTQGDSGFKELCCEAFSPLWKWAGEAGHLFAWNIAKEYQKYRLSKGFITYEDMIDLAKKLVEDPSTMEAIRLHDYHIILDEAQDTDAKQFDVLLGVVNKDAEGIPLGGRYSMVGDPQQAIYSSRADLPTYLKIHHNLLSCFAAQELTFNVTMRCDRQIVAHCNALFPNVLKNKINTTQINFVSLNARPWAQEGYVGKIALDLPENGNFKLNSNDLEKFEAQLLANKIQALGLQALGVKTWSEVAILVPRKNWLVAIKKAFEAVGIAVQIHSGKEIKGDNPAFSWIAALLAIMTSPNDSFEIVGVLREIFGLPDDIIADYVAKTHDKNERHTLNIAIGQNSSEKDLIEQQLQSLHELRNEILDYSLSEAVRTLIEKTDLRNRLLSLPEQNYELINDTLDEILMEAILAEEQGLSILEFSLLLKNDFYNLQDSLSVLENHIQGFTGHKAKGLEWPVVIVPFVFRSILFPPQEYPQVMHLGSVAEQKVVISNHPDKKQWDELLERHRIAELERLLYVTATRPRHKLLWVDDEALFVNKKMSFASLLNITPGSANRQVWNELPTIMPISPIMPEQGSDSNRNKDLMPEASMNVSESNLKGFDPSMIGKASDRSKQIFKPRVPSQLGTKIQIEDNDKSLFHNASSIDYGIWWHTMMQSLPWKARSIWKEHFSKCLSKCPAPSRGEQEIALFYESAHLKNLLKEEALIIQTELPFLYQENGCFAYEGYIDFFAFCEKTNKMFIIDWKTDLIDLQTDATSFVELLRIRYKPQLQIYQRAVEKVYRNKIDVFLYSAPLGKLVKLD